MELPAAGFSWKAATCIRRIWSATTQHAKQEAIEVIGKLPDDAALDEIMYRLFVLAKIRRGQEAVAQGHTTDSETLKREIESW